MANAETRPSSEAWRRHVARWREGGQTVPEYCRQHGLALGAMRYQIRRAPASAPVPFRLARVERVASPATTTPAPTPAIVIEVGTARIHVERGVDPTTLATVMAALGVGS